MPLFRRLSQNDLTYSHLGKSRRFRLSRNQGSVKFKGRLLALYRHKDDSESEMYPGVSHLEFIALFRTKKGRFLACYAVEYPENEHVNGGFEYLKVCENFDTLATFVGAMRYVNAHRFRERVVKEARSLLFPEEEAGDGQAPSPPVSESSSEQAAVSSDM